MFLAMRKKRGRRRVRRKTGRVHAGKKSAPQHPLSAVNRFLRVLARKRVPKKQLPKKFISEKEAIAPPVVQTSDSLQKPRNQSGSKSAFVPEDLRREWLVTDFDRVLSAVNAKGRASEKQLARQLGLDAKKIRACCATLQENGSVRIEYPLIGSPMVISTAYEKDKRRRELEAKGLFASEELLEE